MVVVDQLVLLLGVQRLLRSHLCTAKNATSFFSGMGTAEIAWKAVGAALLARGLPFTLVFTFSCDVDEMCHDVLRAYCSGHIFGDIMAMLGIRE